MSLADHYDPDKAEGGEWLDEGEHIVAVFKQELFSYDTQTPGIELIFRDDNGKQIKHSFCLHKNSVWVMSNFGMMCLSSEEMRLYDPQDISTHHVLSGKRLLIRVKKVPSEKDPSKKYSQIVEFSRAEGEAAVTPAIAPATAPDAGVPSDDEIPF